MTWYVVRVQLVKEKADYAKLHEEMEKRGFSRDTEFGSEDDLRRLPFATYFLMGMKLASKLGNWLGLHPNKLTPTKTRCW